MMKSRVARLLALRSPTVAAFVVLVAGGAALATTANSATPTATPQHTAASHVTPHSPHAAAKSHGPHGAKDNNTHGTPSPSLHGLCHAVQAGATSNPGKAIDNPAFSVLVAAAGGKAKMAGYCADLIGPHTRHSHGKPDDVPPRHPTGPSDRPHRPDKPHPTPHHNTPSHPTGRH